MHRSRAGRLEKRAEQVAVKPGNGEPFGPPGGTRHEVHILGTEAPFAQQAQRVGTGAEGQGVHWQERAGAGVATAV